MNDFTPGPYEYDDLGQMIIAKNAYGHGDMRLADLRGWGHLTGQGACRFSQEKAAKIQDANGRLLASAPKFVETLERIRNGMADDRAYREAARAALASLEETK